MDQRGELTATSVWRRADLDETPVVIYRSTMAFLSMFLYARVLGKQQVSQLTFFEYATGITIGSIAASMSVDIASQPLTHWLGLSVWALLTFVLQVVTVKSPKLGRIISGKPVMIIQNGKVLEKNMAVLRYRIEDLLTQLRELGIFDINQVENAIAETNGKLSIQLKSQFRPVTPRDLGISTPYEGLSHELIVEGNQDCVELNKVGLDTRWLEKALHDQGIGDIQEVFLAVINTEGKLFISPYESNAGDAYKQQKEQID